MQTNWPSVFGGVIHPSDNVLHEIKIIINITTETSNQTCRRRRADMRCDPELQEYDCLPVLNVRRGNGTDEIIRLIWYTYTRKL